MGGLFSSPKAPDPYKTADAQGQANTESARLTATLNRANEYTPFGSQTWSQGGQWDEAGYNSALEAWKTAQGQAPQTTFPTLTGGRDQYAIDPATGQLAVVTHHRGGLGEGDTGSYSYTPVDEYTRRHILTPEPTREDFGYNPDLWSSSVTLDPRLQELLDSNIALQQGMTGAQQGALANVNQLFGGTAPTAGSFQDAARSRIEGLVPMEGAGARLQQLLDTNFSYDSLGAMPTADQETRQRVEDALYERIAGRLDPMYAQRESDLTSRLAAQGITQGSGAYGDEFGILGRDRNDAYSNAALESILMGGDEMARQFGMEMAGRQQGMTELDALRNRAWSEGLSASQLGMQGLGLEQQLAQGNYEMNLQERNQALNELSALMSGTQVQLPQFSGGGTGAQVQAPQIGQYIQDTYNAQMGARNSNMQGLTGLGGALLGAAGQAGGFGALFSGI